MKVSFIGLGVMGFPMAGHLVKAGFEVTVFNRTHSKALDWADKYQGKAAESVAECVAEADVVLVCVGNDDDVRSMTTSETGALAAMKPNAILVDHTTTSAELAIELAAGCEKKGVLFVDAPVSGGQAGAENGVLTVMVGGEPASFDRARTVIESYARCIKLLGPAGSGQLAKMVNQVCIASLLQGLSEGIAFAEKAGLDAKLVVDCISKGAAGSWQMANRYETMLDDHFEHGFATDWMRKDLGICLSTADETGASLPVTALVDQFYKDVQRLGGGRWDTSSLIKRLREMG